MAPLVFILMQLAIFMQNPETVKASESERRLQKYLFEEKNYIPSIRPVLNHSDAVQVVLDLAIQQIISVDVKQEQLTVLYWQRLKWFDEYLQWDPQQYDNVTTFFILPHKIWLPDLVVYNNVGESSVEKDGLVPVSVTYTGEIHWHTPVIYVTTCTIHIKHFPYDSQVCSLKFGSWIHTAAEIVVTNERGKLDDGVFTINGEWVLGDTPAKNNKVEYRGKLYTDVFYQVHITRRALFYEKNLVIPTAMISLLASLTFLLPPESGEKIGLAITVFLALCVNLLLVSEMMPATSLETPILGSYYLMAITMVAVSLVMTVVVLNFHNPHMNARRPPRIVKQIFDMLAPFVLLGRVNKSETEKRERERNSSKDSTKVDSGKNYDLVNNGAATTLNATEDQEAASKDPVMHSNPAIQQLDDKITQLITRYEEEDEETTTLQEWQYLTRIIDRILAVTFFLITVILTYALIAKAKNAAEDVKRNLSG